MATQKQLVARRWGFLFTVLVGAALVIWAALTIANGIAADQRVKARDAAQTKVLQQFAEPFAQAAKGH